MRGKKIPLWNPKLLNPYCKVIGKMEVRKEGSGRERHEIIILDQKVTKLSANEEQKIKVGVERNKNAEKEGK